MWIREWERSAGKIQLNSSMLRGSGVAGSQPYTWCHSLSLLLGSQYGLVHCKLDLSCLARSRPRLSMTATCLQILQNQPVLFCTSLLSCLAPHRSRMVRVSSPTCMWTTQLLWSSKARRFQARLVRLRPKQPRPWFNWLLEIFWCVWKNRKICIKWSKKGTISYQHLHSALWWKSERFWM